MPELIFILPLLAALAIVAHGYWKRAREAKRRRLAEQQARFERGVHWLYGDDPCGYDVSNVDGMFDRDRRTLQDCIEHGADEHPKPRPLVMFGRGDEPEAFVPLPDGKRIPVTFKGESAPPPESKR